ncbi:MAG: putative metal-dependent hydrolase [Bacteroidetes bacterium]|nr:putative metal-dependent hydrolase [Bacteroidota bacterium]
MENNIEHLKYPTGRWAKPEIITPDMRQGWINDISMLPERLEAALAGMPEAKFDTPYRPGGWTVRQVVHHLADSHLNAHCRIRLALTEDNPTIKPYLEAQWALLPDNQLPVDGSLDIIRAVHHRWVYLLKTLTESDFQRTYFHPEQGKTFTLEAMTSLYAWHSNHHLAHVKLVMS